MPKRKIGILQKIDDYRPEEKDLTTIDNRHYAYVGASQVSNSTYLRPVKISYCAICGKQAEYRGIFHQNDITVVERYCSQHAKDYGPLEDIKLRVVK